MRRVLLLLALAACGRKQEGPVPPPSSPPTSSPKYPATEEGLARLLADLREVTRTGDDARLAAFQRDIHPTRESLDRILTGEEGARLAERVGRLWEINRAKPDKEVADAWRMQHFDGEIEVLRRTTEELREDARFRRSHGRVARRVLKPGQAVFLVVLRGDARWEVAMMFAHDGARWFYTDHLYRYLKNE